MNIEIIEAKDAWHVSPIYICTIGGFLKHAKYWSNLQKHYKYAQTQQLDRSICIDKATLKSDLFNYACNEQQSQNEAGTHLWEYNWNEDDQSWDLTDRNA